ncbi:MAG TPA: efflux RND transporter periplasmic adaptor subunit, partial [Burkholderiaceae bacterium]
MDQPGHPHPSAALLTPRRQPSKRARLIGALVALVLLAGLGWLAWHLTHPDKAEGAGGPGAAAGGPGGGRGAGGGGGGRGGRGAPATTVGVATAEQADIPVMLDALGTVAAAATVTVRPQVSGVLKTVNYKEGQMVKAGQLLATIDPRQFEMALMQATGQRQRDQAQLENARLTLQRYRTLLGQDSIARQEVDTQAALVKQLEGTIITDRASEGTARINLGYTRIVAPISGRVGLRTVDIGNVVGANDANGIALITQVSPIDVEFALPQDRMAELQSRADQQMRVEAFDRTRTTPLAVGRFHALDNQVDTQTGTVRAKARFNNDKFNLFPSQFVNIRVLLRTIKDAVVVPVTALRHGNTGDFVFVLNAQDRTVAMRPVTRGEATVDKVQITSGLRAGEQVITEGADRLKDGSKVTLPGDKPAAGGARGGRGRRGAGADGAPAANGAAPAAAPAVPSAAPSAAPTSGGVAAPPASPAVAPGAAPAPGAVPAQDDAARAERRRQRAESGEAGASDDAAR